MLPPTHLPTTYRPSTVVVGYRKLTILFLPRCHHARKLLPGQEHGHRSRKTPSSDQKRHETNRCAQNPPLYLHVTSQTKEGLDQAVEKIEELMKQELPVLVDERRFRRREQEQVERDEFGRVCARVKEISLNVTDTV